ncbi:flagellar filament capping protein FliD [Nocardioides sp. CER19]|uniref:flagellar filament capping protein FliD n=1 Tax=Nocardioides sp. CER19 TaxID=3038538 RepID=UPI002446A157|nr:flagellar filament capping protein FliD [Nocardioides sp. CER19]MDH2414644.1 flagellar filament capping protein FliD [Nocardioides sp. CER19]
MASTIQFSGLSGFDSSSIISALMDVEKAPQTALKTRLANTQTQVSALQQLNTSLSSLSDSAKSFATGSTWTQLSATSSNSAVTVTASNSAAPASFSLKVGAQATAAQVTLSASALSADGGDVTITTGTGASATFAAGTSLETMASKINADSKTNGLQAQVVKDAVGGSVLLLSTTSTGKNVSLTVATTGNASFATATGTNASVLLNDSITVESSTNTFTGLMGGIDVTLGAGATSGTTTAISVAADGASRATAMKAFIGQLNDVLTQLSSATSYGTITAGQASTGGGVLPGDSTLRSVADQLINTVFPAGAGSLSDYGISIDRYGQFTFDADTFTAAYAKDPAKVQAALVGVPASGATPAVDGFAQRVKKVADLASDAYDGSISQYIKNENDEIARYNDQIAAWTDRLAAKQASLEQIYTALETQLSRLQTQQSWLASQIESLDGLTSSK